MRQIVLLSLCILMFMGICSGCGKQENIDNDSDVSQSIENIQSAIDIEPITIPKEEWTLDTICQATYINGKNLQIPCTIHDLGDGFNIIQMNDDDNFAYNEDTHRAGGYLTFNDRKVAAFAVEDCDSIDTILDSPLRYLDFSSDIGDFSISVNSVAVGDELKIAKERLYFMDAENFGDSSEIYIFL